MNCVQNTDLDGTFMCAPSFRVCARLTTYMCARTRAQLRGNVACDQNAYTTQHGRTLRGFLVQRTPNVEEA